MLTAVICPPTMAALHDSLAHLDCATYQCLEIRLDFCRDLDVKALPAFPLPVIITLRSQQQGGYFQGTEEERLALLERLLDIEPNYLDVEDDIPAEILRTWHKKKLATTLIVSRHNFLETPDLDACLLSMMDSLPPQAGVLYKIACQAKSTLDALTMLLFCRRQHAFLRTHNSGLIGISMGEYGTSTRILAPIVHYGICYCPTGTQTAPGQLTAKELIELYNFPALNPETSVYGLLGDPVEQSQGHIFHNKRNKQDKKNAVYVKWHTPLQDVEETLSHLSALDVQGLSVTMPLKNAVSHHCHILEPLWVTPSHPSTPLCAEKTEAEEPINTLRALSGTFPMPQSSDAHPQCHSGAHSQSHSTTHSNAHSVPHSDSLSDPHSKFPSPVQTLPSSSHTMASPFRWEGINTDGEGALRSLPFTAHGKTVIIIGAGGAAMALIGALYKTKAQCFIYNRSPKDLPNGLAALPLEHLFNGPLPSHDLIINTLPFTLNLPFENLIFQPDTLAFDISYAHTSSFLQYAAQAGCNILTGQDMFEQQALLQREFWYLSAST